ncbi:helix-turn-helix domain-containing protein [Pelotomaculum propionicicum]|uniref:Ner winged helix-turn-helix DNA-binding domain-containing protein n=1 Tax=Pelotomaculum propionicicum TaxID=258475 RepID=A0A4Y7RM20_9FIRM|nr:helix-turn-helix domain-containing protein [Pelotomaculum propionicicum]TEB10015.1 hypothetical protein Pmgp_02710 [Pelotomaculum propionicicum]
MGKSDSTGKGMKPEEIRAAMYLNRVKLKDIANDAGVSIGRIHQVIYKIGRNKGYRIRPYIAKAIGKTVEEVWPDETNKESGEACQRACL